MGNRRRARLADVDCTACLEQTKSSTREGSEIPKKEALGLAGEDFYPSSLLGSPEQEDTEFAAVGEGLAERACCQQRFSPDWCTDRGLPVRGIERGRKGGCGCRPALHVVDRGVAPSLLDL